LLLLTACADFRSYQPMCVERAVCAKTTLELRDHTRCRLVLSADRSHAWAECLDAGEWKPVSIDGRVPPVIWSDADTLGMEPGRWWGSTHGFLEDIERIYFYFNPEAEGDFEN